MIRELALERGADVFVRDRKGKRAFDGEKGVGAGDDVSNLLKQGQSSSANSTSSSPGSERREGWTMRQGSRPMIDKGGADPTASVLGR